jgi:S1-C subfamily serine protease
VIVAGVVTGGPAEKAAMRRGDEIVAIAGVPVDSTASLYRTLWGLGPAGVEAPLDVERDGKLLHPGVKTTDRTTLLKKPRLQ